MVLASVGQPNLDFSLKDVSAQSVSTGSCQFRSAPGATPAFCDDLSAGTSPGGTAGDLDDARWSVGRFDGVFGPSDLMPFPQAPASPCKANVTAVNSDNDVLVCDGTSAHQGQFETALAAQNYALLSMRPRQLFDFSNRTGTITYNVDAATASPLGWWTSLYVTQDPVAGANNTSQVSGMTPRNGLGVNFDGNNCQGALGTALRINDVFTYTDYTETDVPVSNGVCIQTRAGSQNHFEIKLSQTHIDVWASDYSTDGSQTFPNFRLIGSAPTNLNFSQGYVHFQHGQRAPKKYIAGSGIPATSSTYYWSDLGFDGPVAGREVAYLVPNALTHDTNTVGDFPNNNNNLNLGYGLLTNPNKTYSCCPQTTVDSFSLSDVDLSGVSDAQLTFSILYATNGSANNSRTYSLKYRLNGGAWQSPSPTPEFAKALYCQAWASGQPFPYDCNWSMGFAFPVALSSLVAGTNTLEIGSDGSGNSFPPILANVELLTIQSSGSAPNPSPTATASPTSTPSPIPTASPIPTPSPTPASSNPPAAPQTTNPCPSGSSPAPTGPFLGTTAAPVVCVSAGNAQAFKFIANGAGTLSTLHVFVAPGSSAPQVQVGL